jgi:transposase InsO family protein
MQHRIMSEFHNSAWGGHSGFPVTFAKLKRYFAWKGMKATVKQFVQSCAICQQSKPDRSKTPGLLQPLPIPNSAWQVVSLDFVEGLPTSSHYNCILVVVDLFTKYGHFVPLRHPFTAPMVAQAFMDHIYRLHGLPVSIISDRDRIFTSRFWSELFQLAGVQLCRSTAYHPQSDGQTERLNQCLETYLHCFVHACPSKWSKWLATAEFWYNTSERSTIGRSPYEALYCYPPRFMAVPDTSHSEPEAVGWSSTRAWMDQLLQSHLSRAKHRMKKQADQHRSEHSFEVGDTVYLKLQPYVQTSLAPRSH